MCKYTNTASYMYYRNEQKYVTMQLKVRDIMMNASTGNME